MVSIEYVHKLLEFYNQLCSPLCQQTGIPQTSMDILMFLKNNPVQKCYRYCKVSWNQGKSGICPCGTTGAGRISRTPGGAGRPEKDRTDLYRESSTRMEAGM